MVLADSHRISRVPCYLGYFSSVHNVSTTGFAPSMTGRSRPFVYIVFYSYSSAELRRSPATPIMQRLPAITHNRFGLFRVRSPLLTESLLFSLPTGTEMFHFPAFPPIPYEFRYWLHVITRAGFPHSEILASTLGYQLHQAYRRFPRPSSAPNAKASTMRP